MTMVAMFILNLVKVITLLITNTPIHVLSIPISYDNDYYIHYKRSKEPLNDIHDKCIDEYGKYVHII